MKKKVKEINKLVSTTNVCAVSIPMKDVCIPSGQIIQLSNQADAVYYEERTPFLFEPEKKNNDQRD